MSKTHQEIHLFNEIWTAGKVTAMKKTLRPHLVIKDPKGKEYHLYDNDATSMGGKWLGTVDPELVKRYILTEILDQRDNWCFDLECKPLVGFLTKVLYDNGTIKNVQFVKEFESEKIELKKGYTKTITPIAWRIR